MSKYSKSVSFEEYRKKPWWDVCKTLEEDSRRGGGDGDYRGRRTAMGNSHPLTPPRAFRDNAGDDFVRTGYHSNNSRSIFEDSASQFPPPCQAERNKFQSQTNELSNNFIMPSSLGGLAILPPPTPFKDYNTDGRKTSSNNFPKQNIINGSTEMDYDIIEIKSPRRKNFQHKESELELTNPMELNGHAKDLWNTLSDPAHQKPRIRTGLFDLPEVYCPPPLKTPQPRAVSTVSQLSRVMPSFVQNTFNSPRQQPKPHCSPRTAYSEPILKSERRPFLQFEDELRSPRVRPEAVKARYPIMITPRTVELHGKNQPPPHILTGQSLEGTSLGVRYAPKGKASIPFCGEGTGSRRTLLYEHNSDPHLLGNVGNEVLPGGAENYRISRTGGDRDRMEDLAKLSKHNCLSPRARIPPIQPSVITPSVSESLLTECVTNLKAPKWEDNFAAFSQIYSLTELHPNKVREILNRIIWHGLPHLSSPRSKLARMACICFKRLFQTQKRFMEVEGEKVFYRLLDICGGLANNFIQQESREALLSAVENMDPLKSISFLELHGAKHKNPNVREFSAHLLTAIMDELPQSKLMNNDFSPRIIPMIVSYLREGVLQTRLHGKLALDKIFDHPTFDSKLKRYVSPENVRHIAETLREFRERRSGHI